jgi:hypothetical protein
MEKMKNIKRVVEVKKAKGGLIRGMPRVAKRAGSNGQTLSERKSSS